MEEPLPVESPVPWHPWTFPLALIGAALLGAIIGLVLVAVRGDSLGPYRYSLLRWEATNLLDVGFRFAGLGPDPSERAGDEAIRRYFALTSQVRAAQDADPIDAARLRALLDERATYENDVERYVQRLIGEAVAEAGLQERLPLFRDVEVTWPPVSFELASPPQLLVRSPRDRIVRDGDTLLKTDLTLEEIEKIERKTTDKDTVSLVVSIGGLAAYPAIVTADRSFDGWLDTTAHEWVHHYLAFYPLGQRWGEGGDAETLNETTANVAGRELANIVRRKHPLELDDNADGRRPPSECKPEGQSDFGKEMRALRLRVDELLAAGRVADAEKAMEDQRQSFEKNCIFIRKLNQAYFAFYGTYADGPASSNPVGPKIERVWELTKDVGRFLRVMREVETVTELDAAIARLEGR